MKYLLRARSSSTFLLIFLATAITLALAGCRDHSNSVAPAKQDVPKLELTKGERIAQVSRILTEHHRLPSEIIDAHFDEQTAGGPDPSGMAPVDYISYMYVKVSPGEMGKWNKLLVTPLDWVPRIDPSENYPWWLNGKDMKNFEFFQPHPLASRDGWVAVSRKTGEIWIYGFTM